MSWVLLSLLYPLIFTIISFADKFIMSHDKEIQWAMPSFTMIIGFIYGTILFLLPSFELPELNDIYLLLISGILVQFASTIYFQAIQKSQASTVIMHTQLQHVIIFLLAYIFLNEKITTTQTIGFFIIIFASINLSTNKEKTKGTKFESSFWDMMLANFLFACSVVLFKSISQSYDFISTASIEAFGVGIGGLIVHFSIPKIRITFYRIWNDLRQTRYLILLTESFYIVGKLIVLLAIMLGPIALVSVLGSVQVFYGIAFGIILTKKFPSIYKESLNKNEIILKLAWSVVLFFGIWLIS
jgi:drug/metabolite transporter (DMT)-like permease